jgi:enoyl-CoA hydratase
MSHGALLVEISDAIATVTINRPDARNALNRETLVALSCVMRELSENDAVRVAILTGSGDKAFSAGGDIAALAVLQPEEARALAVLGQAVLREIECSRKPVIAAVNGFALGGGCELAMCCDFRIAADTAQFGQPEIGIGVIPGFGGTQRLARIVGRGMALELMLTGAMIDAREALRIGLVNRVVPRANLLEEVRRLAATIASQGRIAVKLCMEAVDRGLEMDFDAASTLEAELFGRCFETQDQKEGMTAFMEKRPPVFRDR